MGRKICPSSTQVNQSGDPRASIWIYFIKIFHYKFTFHCCTKVPIHYHSCLCLWTIACAVNVTNRGIDRLVPEWPLATSERPRGLTSHASSTLHQRALSLACHDMSQYVSRAFTAFKTFSTTPFTSTLHWLLRIKQLNPNYQLSSHLSSAFLKAGALKCDTLFKVKHVILQTLIKRLFKAGLCCDVWKRRFSSINNTLWMTSTLSFHCTIYKQINF